MYDYKSPININYISIPINMADILRQHLASMQKCVLGKEEKKIMVTKKSKRANKHKNPVKKTNFIGKYLLFLQL